MTDASTLTLSKKHRWMLLLLVSIVIATNYYAYDALSSIKETLQTEIGITSTDYGIIVAFYAFPNTFLLMAVIGGILLDKFGIRRIGFLFTFFCFLGITTTAYGASDAFRNGGGPLYSFLGTFLTGYSPELKLMIFGRLLFGLGAETSIVVINKIIAKWFTGKELAFAFAVNLAIARLGTAAALILSPILIEAPTGWTTAIWVGAVVMGVGVLAFVIYAFYEKKADAALAVDGAIEPEEEFHISDVGKLLTNRPFLYICALCVTFYSAIFPFQAFCPDLLHNKFALTLKVSGILTSLIIWGTILFTPIFGYLVDKRGRRASLMFWGSAMLVGSHLILSLTTITPYVAMFVLGIAFSLVPASMWPAVPLIVDEKRLGTAYGLMASIQSLGLFAFPILAGRITDVVNADITPAMLETGAAVLDYTYTMLMFAGLGLVGFLFAFLLKRSAPQLEEPSHD